MQTNLVSRTAACAAQWVKNTVAFNRELRDLNRMSDRELRDMGLSRTDVVALSKNMKRHRIGR